MRKGALVVALALGVASPAWAGPRTGTSGHEKQLKGRVGVPFARRLLEGDDPDERLRGIVRLGSIGTPEAIDALVEVLEAGGSVARDPRSRLLAIRALAPHAARDGVRAVLLREVNEPAGSEARGALTPLAPVLRSTAAMALAKSGDKKAVISLVAAVVQGGAPGEAAARALTAYPPASLEGFTEGRKHLPAELTSLLADLGDLRALERLRALAAERDVGHKITATVALARLGDAAALPLARTWLTTGDPRLRTGAAEVLVALGAPEAGASVASLVANPTTRDAGLALAAMAPAPELVGPLGAALTTVPEERRASVVATLGRCGPTAVATLEKLLAKEDTALVAALALARSPHAEARQAIERAIAAAKTPAAKRRAVRAGIVRALDLDDAPNNLRDALGALAAKPEVQDFSAGVFGLVATGAWSVGRALDRSGVREDAPVTGQRAVAGFAAASRGALASGANLHVFAAFLRRDADPRVLTSAAVALLGDHDLEATSTSDLAAWAEGGGPVAPLAARALARRDTATLRGRLKRLLEGTDPVVRAHVALGLGRDPETDAAALLTTAYRFEDDARVRRAIVRGLSRRAEPQREATLAMARDLDPDAGVRNLARAALGGKILDAPALPQRGGAAMGVAWLAGSSAEAATPASPALLPGRLVRADGLAVPFVSDADGTALLPGLPSGPADLQMAPPVLDPSPLRR